jgi:catechol 2,3-dioxygenase-like lactoylglutathione lyase family enzyme
MTAREAQSVLSSLRNGGGPKGGKTMERLRNGASPPTPLSAVGITHVGLKVSDAKRSARFYREILGLQDEPRESGIVYVASGGDRLVLYEEGRGATAFHFGFHVDSPSKVDGWRDWLEKNEVSICEDVTEDKYRSVKFQDPDGHWIEISYEA